MNGAILQLTLREMRLHFTDRRTWVGLGIAVVVLGLSGPFGTYAGFSPVPRVLYWCAVVVLTYGVGYFTASLLEAADLIANRWLRVLVHGALVGVPVWLTVLAVEAISFGWSADDAANVGTLWLYCTLISMTVFAAEAMVIWHRPEADAVLVVAKGPALLERLPARLRGELYWLSMQDHYVEVATDKGRELLLLRLADAMRETEGVAGLQIHRSHWVAQAAVKRAVRHEGKVLLELTDGTRLPVSRGYLAEVRARGLLG